MRVNSGILLFAIFASLFPVAGNCGQSYTLGGNDVVRVTVYGQPDLGTIARIAENGSITLPVVGEVRLGGLTAREAERKIAEVLARSNIVKSPQVGVFIEEFQSQMVAVLGEVGKPGMYAITRGKTLMEMISEAGGLSEEAGYIAILTPRDAAGGEKVVVDLSMLLEGRDLKKEPIMRGGDRIYVPKMERFYVYGEVKSPGAYRFERGMTVMQALAVAGGLSDKGTERGMKIRRKKGDGTEQVLPAKLTEQIQASDVIQVKESLF